MYDHLLEATYNKISELDLTFGIEPIEVVKLVHAYRIYWKPQRVKILLLAESHLYTDLETAKHEHDFNGCGLPNPNYPDRYVRFVYCLSYGENHKFKKQWIDNGKRTPAFWKLFNEAVKGNFIITNNKDRADKIKQKIDLLKKMRDEEGVWLLDASIIALYDNGRKPNRSDYNKILQCSFENYCRPIIYDIKKNQADQMQIIVIGKTVYDRLSNTINKFYPETKWIHQPNAILKGTVRRITLSDILIAR